MVDINEMALDYAKCYQDKTRILFTEKYFSTFDGSAQKNVPFKLFPRQKVFMTSLANNKSSIAIKHRQCGITTISSAWMAAQCVFAEAEAPETILCIANKLEMANEILTKIRDFLLQVPRWYWGDEYYSVDPKSEKNKKDIFVKNSKSMLELFNGCKIYARSSGANAARGISSVSILIFDEAAFIEEGLSVYSSAVAATAAVPNAKIIMVSTPNGKDQLYYTTYKQAIAKENGYNAVEFKWYQDLRYNKFLEWHKKDGKSGENKIYKEEILDETGTVPYDEKHWREMEEDGWKPMSPWYDTMCKSFNNDSVKIAQELDVSFLGSANNVIDAQYIEVQHQLNVREPLTDMIDPLCEETWFWKPPIEGHRYVCAIDPSRGTSEDKTSIEMIDLDGKDSNGFPIVEQVMEYNGRKLGDQIGQMAFQYATMYNEAFIVVDATGGQGDALLLTLINMGYKNMYYEDNNQKTYTVQNNSNENKLSYNNRLPGFHFQGNRYAVLSTLAGMIRNNEFKVRSIRVINELETWIFKENGRIDHMTGAHDDNLCALAMGLFVMKYTLNKLQDVKKLDKAILSSYIMGGGYSAKPKYADHVDMRPKSDTKLPFYTSNNFKKTSQQGDCMWLFSGMF